MKIDNDSDTDWEDCEDAKIIKTVRFVPIKFSCNTICVVKHINI